MDERQARLLTAIIDQFIETALPVGSKRLLEAASLPFDVSPATIRSEMGDLEEQGFLLQPHVSAGRIPTAKGYRIYVQRFMAPTTHERLVRKRFDELREQYFHRKDQERVYEAVTLLSRMIPNIVFATVPHKERVYYMGLSSALKQPEFQQDPSLASGVVEVLEHRLHDVVAELEIDESIRYFIGENDLLPQFNSCSMLLTAYRVRDARGVIGVIGPLRMDYAYNTVALDLVADLLRSA